MWSSAIALLLFSAAAYAAHRLTPWPGALLIRYFFDKGGAEMARRLARHAPAGVHSLRDINYRPGDADARLDVYRPASAVAAGQRLPTLVWVHGGGWITGSKNDLSVYLSVLAARGFTVVGVDYAHAPGARYPKPVVQVNTALGYLLAHADDLGVDRDRIMVGGDSAGAQITAQIAALTTSPDYARLMGIEPQLSPSRLRGVLLACGAYDLGLVDFEAKTGDFVHALLWAYSGQRDFLQQPGFSSFSVARHLTAAFPPAFVTVGNGDALVPQSEALVARLAALGVPTDTLFFARDHHPALPHEYQFDLDLAEAREALERSVTFMRSLTASSPTTATKPRAL
jgi:acetyl esterase/lipase